MSRDITLSLDNPVDFFLTHFQRQWRRNIIPSVNGTKLALHIHRQLAVRYPNGYSAATSLAPFLPVNDFQWLSTTVPHMGE